MRPASAQFDTLRKLTRREESLKPRCATFSAFSPPRLSGMAGEAAGWISGHCIGPARQALPSRASRYPGGHPRPPASAKSRGTRHLGDLSTEFPITPRIGKRSAESTHRGANYKYSVCIALRRNTPATLPNCWRQSYNSQNFVEWDLRLAESATGSDNEPALETILSSLRKDFSKLSARLKTVTHTVTCGNKHVTFRIYYPALRDRKSTVGDLVDVISIHLIHFALPRAEVQEVLALKDTLAAEEFAERIVILQQRATDLFKKAQKATNRNGEAGELILYLLTEWVLKAPQLLAKMSLKTNPAMPVHGADGIHVGICPKTKKPILYWGESKLYADIGKAISEAVKSLVTSLSHAAVKHELSLVQRYIDLSGLDDADKKKLLAYLDPFDKKSNERREACTCLLGFDFDGFQKLNSVEDDKVDATFEALAAAKLKVAAPKVANALKKNKIDSHTLEVFFMPIPSVQGLRDLFQAKIGWKS